MCNETIQNYFNFGAVYLLKGICLYKQGNVYEAKKYMEEAFKITPILKSAYGGILNALISENTQVYPNACNLVHNLEKHGFLFIDKALVSICADKDV